VYASFTVNCTNLPTAVSNYIAHFYVNSTTFQGRIHAMLGTLPGTWRLGISGASTPVSKIFPADLAPNTDYQVVVGWDPTASDVPPLFSDAATLWVNPISSADTSVTSGDAVVSPPAALGFAFRQAGGTTSFFAQVTNLAVATTYDEAVTNVWATNAVAPVVKTNPKSGTNFVGEAVSIFAVAAGQGQANLTYTWRKNGSPVTNPNGNTNFFSIPSAVAVDSGTYDVVVATPYGLTATSAGAALWITNAPVPPTITQSPASTNVYPHQTVALHVAASGPPPISFQWYYNNAPLSDSANFSGSGSDTLTVSDITATDGTVGNYKAVAMNIYGNATSQVAVINLTNAVAASISFLRGLVDTNYVATNTASLWEVTGTVTTFTNLTTGNTASYYLQDGTAGINIFATFASTFRPNQGDVLTWTGFMSTFQGTLELIVDQTSNPASGFTVWSNNIAGLPAPKTIPYYPVTNGIAAAEALEGSLVMLTNVYFGTNSGSVISTSAGTTVVVTNASGTPFYLNFSQLDLDTAGQTMPSFAWSVSGPLTQATNTHNGYQVTVTKFSDIVTNAPSPVNINVARSGNNATITWTAVPYSYSYTVLSSTSASGPYNPIAVGLTFKTANGTYTDSSAGGTQKYYRVTSP